MPSRMLSCLLPRVETMIRYLTLTELTDSNCTACTTDTVFQNFGKMQIHVALRSALIKLDRLIILSILFVKPDIASFPSNILVHRHSGHWEVLEDPQTAGPIQVGG